MTAPEEKPAPPRLEVDVSLMVAKAVALAKLLRCGLEYGEENATVSAGLELLIDHIENMQAEIDHWQSQAEKRRRTGR